LVVVVGQSIAHLQSAAAACARPSFLPSFLSLFLPPFLHVWQGQIYGRLPTPRVMRAHKQSWFRLSDPWVHLKFDSLLANQKLCKLGRDSTNSPIRPKFQQRRARLKNETLLFSSFSISFAIYVYIYQLGCLKRDVEFIQFRPFHSSECNHNYKIQFGAM
jgi:hypothetical protein